MSVFYRNFIFSYTLSYGFLISFLMHIRPS